jgi:geranylgeranyl reductase family protein
METRYDLIVVGAGPAGSSAARRAAEMGLSVLVLERSSFPRPKPCASGLSPRSLLLLGHDVDPVVHVRASVVEVDFGRGRGALWRGSGTAIATTTRRELDALLVELAREAGARFESGCAVDGVDQDADGVRVVSRGRSWRARALVAADGVRSDVRRLGGLPDPPMSGAIYVRAFPRSAADLAPAPDRVILDLSAARRGYGWVFPKRDHLNVGVMSQRGLGAGLKESLSGFLRLRGLESWRHEGAFAFPVPSGVARGGLAAGRVLFVGDAAGLADPVTGEGISHAVASGRIAAESIAASILKGESAPEAYERRVFSEIVPALRALARPGNLAYSLGPRATGLFFSIALAQAAVVGLGRRNRLRSEGWELVDKKAARDRRQQR